MKYFAFLAATLFVSSCAKNEIKPATVHMPDPVAIEQCDETQRNLTQPWAYRQYWCAEKNRKDAVKKHNHIIRLESIRQTRLEVLRVNESIKALVPKTLVPAKKFTVNEKQNLQVKKIQAKTINKTRATALVENNKSVNETPKKNNKRSGVVAHGSAVNEPKDGQIIRAENHDINIGSNKVGFANHREVLGPKGRLAIETIAIAASNASHVRLRGFLAREETLAQLGKTHEQFSVGRALSVKNQLIKHGITESKITILHHRQIRPGAFVEIMFNG